MALQLLARTFIPTHRSYTPVTNFIQNCRHQCTSKIKQPKTSIQRNLATKPFEVNSKVAKDTLIYDYSNPAFFRNMTIFGFAQFGFWIYLMGFSYTTLKDVSPEQESQMLGIDMESLPWWRKVNLGGNMYRNGLASLCAIFAVTVLGISLAYPSRAVRSLHLLKGGQQVRVGTYSIFKSNRDFTTNLDDISCLHARLENKPQIAMKIRKKWLYFMMDKRGRFYEDELFDYVVGLKRQL